MIENCPYLRHWMPRDRLQAAEWIGQFSREMGWSEPPQRFLARDLLHYLVSDALAGRLRQSGPDADLSSLRSERAQLRSCASGNRRFQC